MKITTLFLLASSLAIASCDKSVDSGSDLPLPASTFKDNKITISLDADKVVTDRAIIVTMRCVPLVTGKGNLRLLSSGQFAESMVILESPIVDTLTGADINAGSSVASVPAEFVANQPYEQQWRLRLQSKYSSDIYLFGASVGMDSLYIADSSHFFWLYSDVVKKSTHDGLGYQSGAQSDYAYLRP